MSQDSSLHRVVFDGRLHVLCSRHAPAWIAGLTHKDAVIHNEVPVDTPVAIYAAGKEHAMAIGMTKMSTEDIRKINKDIGVINVHYLNDGLWNSKSFA